MWQGERDVFSKIVKELGPSVVYSRHSEGAFYRMDDGTIVFVYSRYRAGREDGDASDLAAVFSHDGGESFSEPQLVLTCEQCGGRNIMSVSMLRMENGEIGVFYLKKEDGLQCRMFLRRTIDFTAFSDEICCMRDDGFFVVNNDRVIRLRDGRILIAAAYCSTANRQEGLDHHNLHETLLPPAIARFYVSEDDGRSFMLMSECEMPYPLFRTGLQEPAVVELSDGTIVAYFRNNSGRQFTARSTDGVRSWTRPEPSRFTSPPSPLCIKELRDGRFFIVYNPVPLYPGRSETRNGVWTGARTPLVYTIADSHLQEFTPDIAIEEDDSRGFCYCAILEVDGGILLGYCAGGAKDGSTLALTRIRKICMP